ncbi:MULTISPECIES: hypothetical protein [unclassified Agrococcus]|uniref:hypothetical protein n=1 Tax=unclassified Agrococcus TaxID=2615065 RepID=UPI0036168447
MFRPRDAAVPLTREKWKDATRPWDRTAVVSWKGVAVHAGLLVDEARTHDTLTAPTVEVRELLSRRYASMPPTYSPTGKLLIANRSLRGLAINLLRAAYRVVPGDNWTLPIELPATEAGPHTREWSHHDFKTFEAMLSEVQDTDGGPDVVLDPQWRPDGLLHWVVRVGSPMVEGASFPVWSASAPRSPIFDFEEGSDGSTQRSGISVLGKGSGQDMVVGLSPNAGIAGTRIPDMDATKSHKHVESKADGDALALAELRAVREPVRWHRFKVDLANPDYPIDVSQFRLGARTKVWHDGDVQFDEGLREGYVTSLSGDLSSTELTVGVTTL